MYLISQSNLLKIFKQTPHNFSNTFKTTALLLCICLGAPSPIQAQDPFMAKCWSPQDLLVKKGEWRARKDSKRQSLLKIKTTPLDITWPIPKNLRGSIRAVKLPKGQKLIALTLDLCEAAFEISGYDGRIIDYLRAHNIKATLFVGGKWLVNHPERASQLIADPLFEIGSHGWAHRNLRKLKGKRLSNEITNVTKAFSFASHHLHQKACIKSSISNNIQKQIKLFRFPFGTCSRQAMKTVNKNGLLAIQWDVVSGDPTRLQSARRIANTIERRIRPGSIIIAHANGRGWHTAKALPLFIPKLSAKGYRFVTVSELLKAGEPIIAKTCYENRPGDNTHY